MPETYCCTSTPSARFRTESMERLARRPLRKCYGPALGSLWVASRLHRRRCHSNRGHTTARL